MTGSVISPDCFDKDVIAWTVTWPDGRGARGRIPNRGPEWWQLAVARMKQGATVVEIRKPRVAPDVKAERQCKGGGKCPEPMWCGEENECLWDRWNPK